MKNVVRKSFGLMLAVVVVLSSTPPSQSAAEASSEPDRAYRIVALGDSVSAGFEPTKEIMDGTASPYGYVDRVFEQSLFHQRSELTNYAIMGLTVPGLTNLLQGAADGKPLSVADLQDFSAYDPRVSLQADGIAKKTPKLADDLAKADLIVLTIGGNDFGPFIKAAVGQPTASARKIIQDGFDKTMKDYTEDLDKLMTRLHELAPGAQIVLADQYSPLFKNHELYEDLQKAVKQLADALDKFAEQATGKGIPLKIAHVSEEFAGKESSYTYFNAFDGFDTHPKQAGYEAMAQIFAEAIWQKYLKPAPRTTDVPLSVVINGRETPSKPAIVDNTTFLALRDVADAVGADLKWNQKTKTAVFKKNDREVVITIGAKSVVVNGKTQPLNTPAYFQQVGNVQKTYVPLAVISEGLDYQVVFRKKLLTVFINS